MGAIKVTVRDGRIGRDPNLVTDGGGEILMQYETDRPVAIGDRLTLPSGSDIAVIGIDDDIVPGVRWSQTAYAGDL
jgi:hypothetical protein